VLENWTIGKNSHHSTTPKEQMAIKLSTGQFEQIGKYGEAAFPNECCGFILGKLVDGQKVVTGFLPAANEREDEEQYHRFLITPEAYRAADKEARGRGLDVLGFYHSHPNAEARPSQYDLDHAWPWYSYIIVSVKERTAGELTSWVLNDDRTKFDGEDILAAIREDLFVPQSGDASRRL